MTELVRLDAAREEQFTALYRSDFDRVLALVYALSGSRVAAEEIAQEAFTAAHREWARISGYRDPGAWVRAVAMNHARSGVRRRAAEARALVRLRARPQPLAELPADAEAFWRQVRALPRMQAIVVALHYADDRRVDDIAELLQIAPGTVKAHLHAARRRLAQTFGDEIEEEPA